MAPSFREHLKPVERNAFRHLAIEHTQRGRDHVVRPAEGWFNFTKLELVKRWIKS